jgi:hypothetical protein
MAEADPEIQKELTPETIERRHEANQRGLGLVSEALMASDPDVMVVIGDDQKELFHEDNMPGLSVYWGDTVAWVPRNRPDESSRVAARGYPTEITDFPVDGELALHIIQSLVEQKIDVAHSQRLREGQSVGGAFAFIYGRITDGRQIPIIPVMQNTYFPPNQPTPARSFEFGVALAEAIRSFPKHRRVAVIASGGLSHFVVDEEIDRKALEAIREHDVQALSSLPRERLQAGTSEIRNWLTAAGALGDRRLDVFDYVPCYRSPAGTGCGMAFAQWV